MKTEDKINKYLKEEFNDEDTYFDGSFTVNFTITANDQNSPDEKKTEKMFMKNLKNITKFMEKLSGVGDVEVSNLKIN